MSALNRRIKTILASNLTRSRQASLLERLVKEKMAEVAAKTLEEAATRVPVQGEPNGDRCLGCGSAEEDGHDDCTIKVRTFRATVPDAATGRFECDRECIEVGAPIEDCSAHGRTPRDLWGQLDEARKAAYTALTERDDALARIAEAAKLHRPFDNEPSESFCKTCQRIEGFWPCETAVALGLNEGENDGV